VQTVTDLELTLACAQASEVWKMAHEWYPTMTLDSTFSGAEIRGDRVYLIPNNPMRQDPKNYSPLTNDAQAMALVTRFRLSVGYSRGWGCEADDERGIILSGAFHFDSLNRAIVECVARLPAGSIKGCK